MNYKLFIVLLTTIYLSSCKTKLHNVKEKLIQAYKQYLNRSLYWSHFPWIIQINLCSPRYNLLCRSLRKSMAFLDCYNLQKWHVFLANGVVYLGKVHTLCQLSLAGYARRHWLQERQRSVRLWTAFGIWPHFSWKEAELCHCILICSRKQHCLGTVSSYTYIWPCCMACGILVLQPGMEPGSESLSPTHWIARESLTLYFKIYLLLINMYLYSKNIFLYWKVSLADILLKIQQCIKNFFVLTTLVDWFADSQGKNCWSSVLLDGKGFQYVKLYIYCKIKIWTKQTQDFKAKYS